MKTVYPSPDGTGVVQGDSKAMPYMGTETGMNGDSYGADLSMDAENGMGNITRYTQSDPLDETFANEEGEGSAAEEAADKKEGRMES